MIRIEDKTSHRTGRVQRATLRDGGPAYREGMVTQEVPAWGSTALIVVSIAVLVSALVVALRALWNLRNRK